MHLVKDGERECSSCFARKPVTGFTVSKRREDGTIAIWDSVCKSCRREKRAEARGAERKIVARVRRNSPGPELPIEPFRTWLKEYLAGRGAWDLRRDEPCGGGIASIMEIATSWGIPERRIREHLKRGDTVSVSFVDRVLCRAGMPHLLGMLYPEVDDLLGVDLLPEMTDAEWSEGGVAA